MRRRVRHREPGQAIIIAATSMVALLGAMAMVIDIGIFFVVQRQLQTAADAGALAGAWHSPVCLAGQTGCLAGDAAPGLTGGATVSNCAVSGYPACDVAQSNANAVADLCGGSVPPPTVTVGTQLVNPQQVNTIVVTVQCD